MKPQLANGKLERAAAKRDFPAPDIKDKLWRATWNLVNATVFRWTPVQLFRFRRQLLRAFGGKIADGARPYPGARIWAPWNLEMADRSCLADGVICYNVAKVVLGRNATVSQRAFLCTPSHDIRRSHFPLVAADIVIEENAWIAAEAFVGPGVRVHRNAVVGARAVLNATVPPDTVVAGNPATIVGSRIMQGGLATEAEGSVLDT